MTFSIVEINLNSHFYMLTTTVQTNSIRNYTRTYMNYLHKIAYVNCHFVQKFTIIKDHRESLPYSK